MEDMEALAAAIFKAINDLEKSGIIDEIVSGAAADLQGPKSSVSLSENAVTREDDDTSD